jgi:hypothetical protein
MNERYNKYKETYKKYREENKEKIREINREYRRKTKNLKSKEWREKNKDKDKSQRKAEKERNKEKYLIRAQTLYKYGKAKKCCKCGSTNKVEHHHITEPYKVDVFIDLCEKCHKKTRRVEE